MKTKVLIIAVVEKDGKILMRKKPDGSPPYSETWYVFGAEADPKIPLDEAVIQEVKNKAGVTVVVERKISWDTEVKNDLDGELKFFVYLDVLCRYSSGDLVEGPVVERLAWVEKGKLNDYDIVPPSRVLFQKLGYL